jgi:glycerophosphoryl diester phosphodiesterase
MYHSASHDITMLTFLRFATLSITFALVARLGFAQEAQPWSVRDHVPLEQFVIQAHRGAGELAEENTLEAFTISWRLGCVPEADVRTTKDGVLVAFHDANFKRLVKDASPELAGQSVADLTLGELQQLDVGSWKGERFAGRRVPTMSAVFAAMQQDPNRRLYVDIKEADLEKLAAEVGKYEVAKQVILASTKYPLVREWKKRVPDSQTLLWMGGDEAALEKRFEELRATKFADVTQLQIHAHLALPADKIARDTPNPFKESDAFLTARGNELRQHGIVYQTLPWGGSTPEIYAKLLDLGFMSFATDHPEVTLAAVKKYYNEK